MTATKMLVPLALAALALVASPRPLAEAPVKEAATPVAPRRHCQVPCGIYGDKMRIDMLMEDAATIEKAMSSLGKFAREQNWNQLVRWTTAKDEHATAIQDRIAAYWLAQRVKVPAQGADAAAMAKYAKQLQLLHGITVAAMKCKQTTDPAWVAKIRKHALAFSETYFSKKDLEHIKSHHHGHDHK